MPLNLSLLSISSSSESSDDDNEIDINQYSYDRDSSSSRECTCTLFHEPDEHKTKPVDLDSYIFNKHLNGISSTSSSLAQTDVDKSIRDLFDEDKSSYQQQEEDYNPRAIRPPSFSQYIKRIQDSQTQTKPMQRRSTAIPVRTTKAEQLKLIRQQSASRNTFGLPDIRPVTSFNSQTRSSTRPLTSTVARPRTSINTSYRRSESAESCKTVLGTNDPLVLSSMLANQMRRDIQSNRGKYSLRKLSSIQCPNHSYEAAMVEWLRCSTRIHKVLCSNLSITIHGMPLDKSLTAQFSRMTHSYHTEYIISQYVRRNEMQIPPSVKRKRR